MNTAWFIWLGFLLVGYAVFDGIDLGAGALHLYVARNERERREVFSAIGPFWSGYEVWLIAAGGSMVAAFPRLYAASFSGFYIVLTLVLWLLIGRGLSIEFRGRIADPLWHEFWDTVFFASSALLAVVFGAAAANVVRGVPLDATGNFQGSLGLALNPYAILVGLFSLVLLSMHGANFLAFRTGGDVELRAQRIAIILLPVAGVLGAAVSAVSFFLKPGLVANFIRFPYLLVLPLLCLIGLAATRLFQTKHDYESATKASAVAIVGLLGSAGASLYPTVLTNLNRAGPDLTIYNTAAPHSNLVTALVLNVLAMCGVVSYQVALHRIMRGKVTE